jgi:hypothetical protein
MNWAGHWHGYGPWIGTRAEYGKESLRRPGATPDDPQTREFMAATLPPLMTGHALLRRNQAARDRTWTTVQDAVEWLTKIYADRPPYEHPGGVRAYVSLEEMVQGAQEHLPLGKDTAWVYYARTGEFVSYSVICCPSHFHPDIPCPLPPR